MMFAGGHARDYVDHLLHADDHVLVIVVVVVALPTSCEEDVQGGVKIECLKNTKQRRRKSSRKGFGVEGSVQAFRHNFMDNNNQGKKMKLKKLDMTLLHGLFVKIAPQLAYAFAMSSEAHDSCTWGNCEGSCAGNCSGSCGPPSACGGSCAGACENRFSEEYKPKKKKKFICKKE